MATWTPKANARPIGTEVTYTDQPYVVGEVDSGRVYLREVPHESFPLVVTNAAGTTTFTRVTTAPAAGEYRATFTGPLAGLLEFNAANNGAAILVDYTGRGSQAWANDINRLQTLKRDTDVAINWSELVSIPTTIAYQNQQNAFIANQTFRTTLLGEIALKVYYGTPSHPFFRIMGDGKHEWGDGVQVALDTNLYRAGADLLRTDDGFYVGGGLTVGLSSTFSGQVTLARASANLTALGTWFTGATANPFAFAVNGELAWGTGAAVVDTFLRRSGVGELKTLGKMIVVGSMSVGADIAPTAQLHVAGNAVDVILKIQNNAVGGGIWTFNSRSDGNFYVAKDGVADAFNVDNAGNVGFYHEVAIRSGSPLRLLNTSGGNSASVRAWEPVAGHAGLQFSSGGNLNAMYINNVGNIGVGTLDIEAWSTATFQGMEFKHGAIMSRADTVKQLEFFANAYFDGNWKYKNTGTGAARLVMSDGTVSVLVSGAAATADAVIAAWVTSLTVDALGTTNTRDIQPAADNTYACGWTNRRWTTIYAVASAINTSARHLKTGDWSAPLSPDRGMEAVRGLPIYAFQYRAQRGVQRFGPVLDEIPFWMRPNEDGESWVEGNLIAVNTLAIQNLDSRVSRLEEALALQAAGQ